MFKGICWHEIKSVKINNVLFSSTNNEDLIGTFPRQPRLWLSCGDFRHDITARVKKKKRKKDTKEAAGKINLFWNILV